MSDLPQPRAARVRLPSWRDTRFLVGVAIVLACVALNARLLAALDHSVPVYAAAVPLPAGRALGTGDLVVVRVRVGSGAGPYLGAEAGPPRGQVVLRPVGLGELVPASAIGPASALQLRPVSVPVSAPVPDGLHAGAVVDVWSSARVQAAASSGFAPPVRLASGAQIVSVSAESSQLGLARGAAVQVMLTEADLRAVLDALANGARVTLVPGPGGVG